ncbi:hypothetical protein DSM109990_04144 (plasmid) [Sulfitobacter dubius]|uniref:Uncharacterized protein n=1 Tax=Sulfitobacter dubius TaxID=218673 RepID=A0ABY3ZRK7_9RHOB|nr:hypothetical protein DSM109990_04144 [Sulfitobacter dubius]
MCNFAGEEAGRNALGKAARLSKTRFEGRRWITQNGVLFQIPSGHELIHFTQKRDYLLSDD